MMKYFITTITTLVLFITTLSAQTHFPKTLNVGVSAGYGSLENFEIKPELGFVFTHWFALNARYYYNKMDKASSYVLHFNNLDIYGSFTPVSVREFFFLNLNIGVAQYFTVLKTNNPAHNMKNGLPYNLGVVGDAELEFAFARYFSAFVRPSVRMWFYEPEFRYKADVRGEIGVRINSRFIKLFKKNRYE